MFQPDPKLYPEYDPLGGRKMVEETTAYFAEFSAKICCCGGG
ncbi:MAG: hypothetical protein CM1200mP29_16220 [Verrucomicrobiota bacterium]|nr:MAG: hypothetical protein CM1200mP29_16220 [Verrucomicrobiota bacterium]